MVNPRIVVEATGDFRRLYAEISQGESRFGRMGATIKAGLVGSALAGTAALVKLGSESVSSASDAQQSIGATESVFGRYADTVVRRSKDAAEAVGVSANEYRELANVTGAMLASSGLPLERVTNLTDKLTRRAADMAATFGGTTKEAIEAVSSLLRGEADPIERYGVSIKQSDVNARLAAQGLSKLEGEAKKQAEQQARLELLFRQTAKSAGQFGREEDSIAGKGQRLGAKVEDLEAKFGTLLIPVLAEGADLASDELVPALDELADWIAQNKDEFAELGGTVKDTVVPPLKLAVDVAEGAVEVFGDLPGPVKELAAQAGVAALVLPRLTSAVGSITTAGGGMVANLRDAEKRTAALSGAAKQAAGVGGLLALTQGFQMVDAQASETDQTLGFLMSTAGGAALGFSVAGPWGAAIGGGAGALLGLAQATETTEEAAFKGNTTWETYAATMDRVTGATTAATRATIAQELQQSGLLKAAAQFGISKQLLVDGINGEKKARDQLTATLKDQQDAVDALKSNSRFFEQSTFGANLRQEASDRQKLIDKIKEEVGERKKGTAAAAELAAIANRIPEEVQTKIQAVGADLTARQIARLAEQYGLTPKQVATVIKVSGSDATRAQVKAIREQLASVAKEDAGKKWGNRFAQDLAGARPGAQRGVDTLKGLLGGVGNARPNIAKGPFGRGVSGDLSALITVTNQKASGVGNNLGRGMYNGMGPWIAPIAGRAREMVLGAISAANGAALINSPSRKTRATGEALGEGLAVGMQRSKPAARAGGRGLIAAVAAGVVDGSDGVEKALDLLTKRIQKGITGKNQAAREKAYLRSLRDEYAALRLNGAQQDAVNQRLETARDRVKDLVAQYHEYSRAIRDTITATGNVTELGKQDDGTVKIRSLLDELRDKVANADRFSVLVTQLAAQGLSQTAVQQLLDAGPESALATAEAIKAGGAASIKELNALQARLAATGDKLGDMMAARYKTAGVRAAQGVVVGLEAQARNLDAAGVRMANVLVAAVKKALRIKSPSREFAEIANRVTDGLTLQLDANSTYVKRSGELTAAALVKGFASPQLDARVLTPNAGLAAAPVRVEVRLTADQLSAAQRGKAVLLDITAAQSVGSRPRAVAVLP